ncbi:hypothetical protein PsYK624_068350 [Phanerochaete sordida]|uniref:Uncharacterized protein n=1 Tax=Phanerochaete sordida TaxID=48140 RepID=A0A9P3G9I8_9APHY|nr:hypothetical protein PsYK624_068350 [Phanerochaete sordida]
MNGTQPAGISHGSAYPPAAWRASPSTRGTFEIITTCLSTLVICVWSAVHADVPLHQSRWAGRADKLGWLVTGLVAPDLLLYAACCQLYRAHVLLGEARRFLHVEPAPRARSWFGRPWECVTGSRASQREHTPSATPTSDEDSLFDYKEKSAASQEFYEVLPDTPSTPDQPKPTRKHRWTLTHAFYGVMGGFVLETSPMLEGETRFVLTLSGLRFVLENAPDLLPDLSKEEIQRKSRSDVLGKTLLILQLLYFCISCTARLAQKLPLSLLEVFTLAHALCTVVTCVVWWQKPFDVLEPTLITGPRADELAAYMLFTSRVHKDYIAGLIWYLCDSESSYLKVTASPADKAGSTTGHGLPRDVLPGESFAIEGYTFEVVHKKPDPHQRIVYGRSCLPWYNRRRGAAGAVALGTEDLARWTLAARGLRRYGDTQLRHARVLVSRHGGLQMSVFKHGEARWWPAVSLAIATVYGVVHVLAWDAQFPTPVERTLWRSAAVTLIVLGLAFFQYAAISTQADSPGRRVSKAVFNMCLWLYPFASGYVLLESLRQLLYLPDRTFMLPSLSIYLPHFS